MSYVFKAWVFVGALILLCIVGYAIYALTGNTHHELLNPPS